MNTLSRRGLMGAAGTFMIVKPETAFGSQANSKVAFGIIGTGGRGTYVGGHMAKDANARLAAICDIYPDRIDRAKTVLPGADKVKAYKDLNELLAQPDLDAVLISTPVFLHPPHFEAAVKAKKHIYCEKPAGASVAGVKRLLAAAKLADPTKTIQFGFQQRYSPEYLRSMAIMKDGKIGSMKIMMSYWVLGNEPPTEAPKNALPPEEEKIRRWGSWQATSGGPIVEQDCHGVDTLNWFAGAHPLRAIGTGGLRYPLPYGDHTSDHHNITYYYPGGLEGYLISIKHTAGYRDVKEQFYGLQGHARNRAHLLQVARHDPLGPAQKRRRPARPQPDGARRLQARNHHRRHRGLLQEHRREEAPQHRPGRRRQHLHLAAWPHGLREEARSHLGRAPRLRVETARPGSPRGARAVSTPSSWCRSPFQTPPPASRPSPPRPPCVRQRSAAPAALR